jgi:hypothetical protein
MIVSNGLITRNISEKQLPEYKAKGYKEVVKAATSTPSKSAKKTGDK